jgi:hypothetical protein
MFFRKKRPPKLSPPDEHEVKSPVSLALSTLDAGIKRTRETRLNAVRIRTVAEQITHHAPEK